VEKKSIKYDRLRDISIIILFFYLSFMYNLYKYQADVLMQEQNRTSEENYTKWLLTHEGTSNNLAIDIKNKASDKLK
jgi:hypothetical protein